MLKILSSVLLLVLFCTSSQSAEGKILQQTLVITFFQISDIKWCVVSETEYIKCTTFISQISLYTNISQTYNVTCILTRSYFECMEQVNQRLADFVNLDVGLAYYAVQNYGMRMFAMENYKFDALPSDMNYTAVGVVISGTVTSPLMLNGTSLCSAGNLLTVKIY